MKAKRFSFAKKFFIAALAVAVTLSMALTVYSYVVSFGEISIILTPSCEYQEIERFGASSAWVYQELGALQDFAFKDKAIEMLYGEDGANLNTFRYNIGGGGRESDNYPDILRGEESYFIAERFNGDYSVFKDVSNYDFTRDAGVRDLLERALKLGGLKKIVFFANSPHYFMTLNGKTHGEGEKQNNLKEECYGAFSDYLLVITDWLYKNVICKYDPSIEVSISPINEPQWKWGGAGATQEGCHYDPKPLAKFCDVFYRTLKDFNLTNGTAYQPDFFESGSCQMKVIKPYLKELAKYDWFKNIKELSVHSYNTELDVQSRRWFFNYLNKSYPDIKVNMSEYCVLKWGIDEGIDMGLYSARIMLRDFADMHASSWSYWLSVSNGDYEDGLVYWNKDGQDNDVLRVTKRFYTFGQFSKYTVGSKMIKSEFAIKNPVGIEQVAFKYPDGRIVLVIINDTVKSRNIKIKGYKGDITEIVTNAEFNQKESEYSIDEYISIDAKTIGTFILPSFA